MNELNPADEKWTDDRLLHEGVWIVEQQLYLDRDEVAAWARFVRRVWAAQDARATDSSNAAQEKP